MFRSSGSGLDDSCNLETRAGSTIMHATNPKDAHPRNVALKDTAYACVTEAGLVWYRGETSAYLHHDV